MSRFFMISILILLSAITTFADETTYETLDKGLYRLTIPDNYSEDTPVSLMIALHSTSSSPHAMEVTTGFNDYAEDVGMIVAYPQADGAIWNEGDPENEIERDDVAFITDVIEDIQNNYNIDGDHIWLSGFGSGGLMAFRLACESPELFHTVAIVGAMMWGYHTDNCPDTSSPVNMLIVRGSEDIYYLEDSYELRGLFSSVGRPILGVEDTLSYWTTRFNCNTEISPADHILLLEDCDDNVTVAYYEIDGARQNWIRNRDDWTLNQFGIDVTEIILDFATGDEEWQSSEITESPRARTYSFYVPTTYDESDPTPVVVLLHGRFGNGAGTAAYVGMNELAEDEVFIGVYPNGLDNINSGRPRDTGWNYVRGVPYFPGADTYNDVQFISDVIDDISQDLNIDRNRIYVTGISNGGFMVQRLACEAPDQYAGFASVAGAGFGGMTEICESNIPVNMLVMHGTHDNNILWNGNVQRLPNGREFYGTMPITETMEYWARKMECFGESTREDVDVPESEQETGLTIFRATDCNEGVELVLYAIIYGGHNWPGIEGGIPRQVAGQVNLDVDATQIIWDFFKSHSLADFD